MDVVKIPAQATQPQNVTGREARLDRQPAVRDDADARRALVRALAGSIETAVVGPQRMEVRMRVEADLHRVVARVVDSDTGEVIREVPPEELVELAKRMKALMGAMLDKRA